MVFKKLITNQINKFIRSRIYLPDNLPSDSGDYGGINFDRISVRTDDGLELAGLRSETQSNAKYTLLYFHGNGGCAATRAELVAPLVDFGADVIVADYRGYGNNPGHPSEEGLLQDAKAFLQYAEKSTSKPIILFGHSLGGALAVQLIAKYTEPAKCSGILTLGMFSSLAARAPSYIIPLLPDSYDGIAVANHINIPWHILHERHDEVTSYLHSKAIFDSIHDTSDTKLKILKGGSHRIDVEKIQPEIDQLLAL